MIVFEQPSKEIILEVLLPKDRAEVANPNEVPISKMVVGWK